MKYRTGRGYSRFHLTRLVAKEKFQENKKVVQAALVLRVAACCECNEGFELAVELGFILVTDAPVNDAIGFPLRFYNVVHLAPVFEFL